MLQCVKGVLVRVLPVIPKIEGEGSRNSFSETSLCAASSLKCSYAFGHVFIIRGWRTVLLSGLCMSVVSIHYMLLLWVHCINYGFGHDNPSLLTFG